MAKLPIALQLYSVREDCARDFLGVLAAVAKMGYAGVEFAGYHGRAAAEIRRTLEDNNLQVAGAHTPLADLLGEKLGQTVEFNRALGNPFLIVPSLPEERRNSRAALQETAQLFNAIAEKLKPFGMKTGFHSHAVDFTPVEGVLPWEFLFAHTDPEVIMQLDTGNALSVGVDPLPWFEKFPGRAVLVHLKEHSRTNEKALIGQGEVPWPEVFRLSETIGGTQWYIVEQETYAYPPLECAERCLKKLREMGK